MVNPCLLGTIRRAPILRMCCSIPEPAHVGIYLQQHPLAHSEIAAQHWVGFFFPFPQNLTRAKPQNISHLLQAAEIWRMDFLKALLQDS